jgi:hypothetical protein
LDKGLKFAAAVTLIGLALLFLPMGGNGGTIFSTFWGSPWISGVTGLLSGGTSGGTNQQVTLLTSGTVNFKMSLVSTYTDNTNETIFERSTLPGLAVISIHGKPVRQIAAYALAAVKVSQSLPSGSLAKFELNFTTCVEQLNRCKWNYQVTTTELVGNGTLALVALPPFVVLPTDVFPTALAAGTVTSRRADWNLKAHVTVTAPGYQPLDLLGSDLSYADFGWDGSLAGGCTDCSTSGSIIGGAVGIGHGAAGTSSYQWYLDNPTEYCAANPGDAKCTGGGTPGLTQTAVVTETYTNVVGYITGQTTVEITQVGTRTGTGTVGGTTAITGTLAPPTITSSINVEVGANGQTTTTYVTTDHSTGKTTTQTATGATQTTLGSHTYVQAAPNTSPTGGAGYKPGQQGVIMSYIPLGPSIPLSWTRLDMGSEVYLVNPATWLVLAAIAIAVAYMLLQRRKAH